MKKRHKILKINFLSRCQVFNFVNISLIVILLYSCSQVANKPTLANQDTLKKNTPEKISPALNDVARFIAGLDAQEVSELTDWRYTKTWKVYAAESDEAWKKFENVANKYRSFSQAEIRGPYDTIQNHFYPFSGPDFLFANIVFPKVKNIILIGLESTGSIPELKKLHKDSLKSLLELYKSSIEDIIHLSFFRTLDMKEQLANSSIDGVTPILMLFLARSEKEIVKITYMYLNPEGKPVLLNKPEEHKNPNVVEIQYKNKNENKICTLLYLSTNLADPSLSKNKPFVNFLKNIDNNSLTFIKSATYLMHKSYFSIIRKTCLTHSKLILQDDSGIAFKFFDTAKWNIQLYGNYTKPIELFEDFYEPDYFEAFKNLKAKPLKFRFGYNQSSNILLATKK
jgi:hypothetical protein